LLRYASPQRLECLDTIAGKLESVAPGHASQVISNWHSALKPKESQPKERREADNQKDELHKYFSKCHMLLDN